MDVLLRRQGGGTCGFMSDACLQMPRKTTLNLGQCECIVPLIESDGVYAAQSSYTDQIVWDGPLGWKPLHRSFFSVLLARKWPHTSWDHFKPFCVLMEKIIIHRPRRWGVSRLTSWFGTQHTRYLHHSPGLGAMVNHNWNWFCNVLQ